MNRRKFFLTLTTSILGVTCAGGLLKPKRRKRKTVIVQKEPLFFGHPWSQHGYVATANLTEEVLEQAIQNLGGR